LGGWLYRRFGRGFPSRYNRTSLPCTLDSRGLAISRRAVADRDVSDALGLRSGSAIGEEEARKKSPVAHRLDPTSKRAPPSDLACAHQLPRRHRGAHDAGAMPLDAPKRKGHRDREPRILVAGGDPSRDHSAGGVAGFAEVATHQDYENDRRRVPRSGTTHGSLARAVPLHDGAGPLWMARGPAGRACPGPDG